MKNASLQTGRLRLRHLLEVTEAVGEEMAVERGRFDRLRDPNAAPRVVSAFNLFQTPPKLAANLADLLRLDTLCPSGRILEPSAGLGRLYHAARELTPCPITLVELAPECCGELYRAIQGDAAARLIQGDFLAMDADRLGGLFDRVLMNPPFKQGRDIKHIEHARRLLAPGGRLVALCANRPRQQAKLRPAAIEWYPLPDGSFRSEGTNVAAAMAVFAA